MAKRTQYYCPFLTPSALPPLLSREFPRTPAGGEVEAPLSKGAGRVSGLGDSDRLCVAAHSRATSAREKWLGCRPPSPLSSATRLRQSVGAGHARPAASPLPPRILCIVGRGLDPSAGRRGRRPLQNNPQGFSLPQTSAAAWGQAALHPTLPHSVGRAFARNSFTPPCRGRACPARNLAIATPYPLHRRAASHRASHNRPAPSNTKINLPATSRRQVVFCVLNSFRFLFF